MTRHCGGQRGDSVLIHHLIWFLLKSMVSSMARLDKSESRIPCEEPSQPRVSHQMRMGQPVRWNYQAKGAADSYAYPEIVFLITDDGELCHPQHRAVGGARLACHAGPAVQARVRPFPPRLEQRPGDPLRGGPLLLCGRTKGLEFQEEEHGCVTPGAGAHWCRGQVIWVCRTRTALEPNFTWEKERALQRGGRTLVSWERPAAPTPAPSEARPWLFQPWHVQRQRASCRARRST